MAFMVPTSYRDGTAQMNMNGYQCFACAKTQAVEFEGFLCPVCGANLDVTYDYEAIAAKANGEFGDSGDIFRFEALLPLKHVHEAFPLRVGNTPFYAAKRLGARMGLSRVFLKDDSLNPSASLKDRASAVCIRRAIDIRATTVSVASTGNAGSSLACLAAACGLSAVVFVPASAPPAKLTQMLAFGARVFAVRGNYDDAYDLCRLASDEFGWFNRSTGYNPFTREGKKTCTYEIWENLGRRVPDRVIVSTGDGNTLSAIWKGWCDLKTLGWIERLPKIDCVQSDASAAICNTIRRIRDGGGANVNWSGLGVETVVASTVADSISVDRPRDGLAAVKAVIDSGGEAVTVADQDILSAIPEMAECSGVFPEPAAAAPWAGLRQMATRQRVEPDELVVCIVSGSGLKDIANARLVTGEPQLIEPTLEALRNIAIQV